VTRQERRLALLAGLADSAPLLYLAVIVLVCCAVVGASDLLQLAYQPAYQLAHR
jgi:hypothetical protein